MWQKRKSFDFWYLQLLEWARVDRQWMIMCYSSTHSPLPPHPRDITKQFMVGRKLNGNCSEHKLQMLIIYKLFFCLFGKHHTVQGITRTGSFTPLLTYPLHQPHALLWVSFLINPSWPACHPEITLEMKQTSEDELKRGGEYAGGKESQTSEAVARRGGIGGPLVKSPGHSSLILLVWRPLAGISVSSVDADNLQHGETLSLSLVLTKSLTSLVVSLVGSPPKQSDMVNSPPVNPSLLPSSRAEGPGR